MAKSLELANITYRSMRGETEIGTSEGFNLFSVLGDQNSTQFAAELEEQSELPLRKKYIKVFFYGIKKVLSAEEYENILQRLRADEEDVGKRNLQYSAAVKLLENRAKFEQIKSYYPWSGSDGFLRMFFASLQDYKQSIDERRAQKRAYISGRREYSNNYQRKYRAENCDRVKELARKWRAEHREQLNAKMREWHAAHREQVNEKKKAYRETHREEYNARERELYQEQKEYKCEQRRINYYKDHTHVRAVNNEYYQNNREKIRAYRKAYREKNIEKVRGYCRKYYAEHKEQESERKKRAYMARKIQEQAAQSAATTGTAAQNPVQTTNTRE